MSKKQERIRRAAQKTKAVIGQHVGELVSHTLEASEYNGHCYAEGRQGPTGHPMPAAPNFRAVSVTKQNRRDFCNHSCEPVLYGSY